MGQTVPLCLTVLILHGCYGKMAYSYNLYVPRVRVRVDPSGVVSSRDREIPESINVKSNARYIALI